MQQETIINVVNWLLVIILTAYALFYCLNKSYREKYKAMVFLFIVLIIVTVDIIGFTKMPLHLLAVTLIILDDLAFVVFFLKTRKEQMLEK